jgi:hypothetical protein
MTGEAKPVPSDVPRLINRETLPLLWEADHVGKRLGQALGTLDRLPRLRGPREPGGHWPRTLTEWADRLAQAELEESERRERERAYNRTVIRPTAVEIQRMDAALEWLRELHDLDSGMALVTTLWALRSARGRSIKSFARKSNGHRIRFFESGPRHWRLWRRFLTRVGYRCFDEVSDFWRSGRSAVTPRPIHHNDV